MIALTSTSDVLRVTTSSANALSAVATYADNTTSAFTPGREVHAISSVTTTTVVGSPASSTQRNIESLNFAAKGGANTVTVELFDGSTAFQLVSVALASGETLCYEDGAGWRVLTALGEVKGVGPTGPTGATGATGPTGPQGSSSGAVLMWAAASNGNGTTVAYLPALPYDAGLSASTGGQIASTLVMPRAGTLRNLFVATLSASVGLSTTFTVQVNGVDTAITCTMASSTTSASDTTHSVSVSAGDQVRLKEVNSTSGSAANSQRVSLEYA